VEISDKSPTLKAERSSQPSLVWNLLLKFVDLIQLVGLLTLVVLVLSIARAYIFRGITKSLLAVIIIVALRNLGINSFENQITYEIVTCIAIFAFVFRRDKRGLWIAIVLSFGFILLPQALRFLQYFYGVSEDHWWGQLIFRSRDSDWLVYQGYARQIFINQSLQGGENIFYFMPGMRYFVFLEHVLFGENDVFIAMMSCLAMVAVATIVFFVALIEIPKQFKIMLFGVFLLMIIQLSHPLMLELSMSTAAEVPAWVLFMCASVMAFRKSASERQRILAAAFLGLVVNFRPNYAFAVAWTFLLLLIVSVLTETNLVNKTLSVARSVVPFIVTASLSLLHNLYYGGSGKPFTNISDPGQKDFEPSELLHFFTNQNIRNIVGQKLLIAMRWNTGNVINSEILAAIGIQILWVCCVFMVVKRRRNVAVCIWALTTPIFLLVSYMPFHFTDIPQRHFLMVSITFAFSTVSAVLLSNNTFAKARTLGSDLHTQ
jgi:hypothetical protein